MPAVIYLQKFQEVLNKSQNSKLKTVRWLFRTHPGCAGRVSLWSGCWHVGSLFRWGLPAVMPGGVLNTILPKIKVKFNKNFEFMKTRLSLFRLLLFRQFLSLKLILTFRSTTQINIQDLICSRGETFARNDWLRNVVGWFVWNYPLLFSQRWSYIFL